jgi:D-glycero-D-manno-heptose 1,7-bisphosphate phosphatase
MVTAASGRRAVFLDRDGVINANIERDRRPYAPTTLDEFRFLPEVGPSIRQLKAAGFLVIIVTNQPDVPNGITAMEAVEAMHARIRAELPVDDIEVCFHTDADGCDCRKPKPGMLLAAARKHGIDLRRSWMVGDRWRDIDAGRAAGCLTVFVDYGYVQDQPVRADKIVASLAEATQHILRCDRRQEGGAS